MTASDGHSGDRTASERISRSASAVALYVYTATDIDVTATETLRLSHLGYSSPDGFALEPHGDLLRPGITRLRLEVGVYHFKSVRDVELRIHRPGTVKVVTHRDTRAADGVDLGRAGGGALS